MNGQNGQRPNTTSRAGSSVSIEIIAIAIPSAPIGPRPAVPLTSAIDRHISARITVTAEATIAGPAVAQRGRQGDVPVGLVPELLAVAGDEQQRIVGARAQDEDREDR